MEVNRGDIYWVVDDSGGTGSEQRGDRPAIVVSSNAGNKTSPVVEVVCLTTADKKSLATHVDIFSAPKKSIALCEQIISVSKNRLSNKIGQATKEEMEKIDEALAYSLGMKPKKTEAQDMQIKISTQYGDMAFEMGAEKVMSLVQMAVNYAEGKETPVPMQLVNSKALEASVAEEKKSIEAEKKKVLPGVYVREAADFPPRIMLAAGNGLIQPPYKGFLIVKCESCGEVKGFCARQETSEYRCRCGARTPLHDMRFAFLRCKCGKEYKYKTNIDTESFTFPCLNCGSPIDAELNFRKNTYITVGD